MRFSRLPDTFVAPPTQVPFLLLKTSPPINNALLSLSSRPSAGLSVLPCSNFPLPASSTPRLRKTRCTGCIACTTAAALNAGSEFRLLAVVGAGDIFLFPSAATARLRKTRCTVCIACTTGIAFNGGSESRLLMPVGRAPDVARGPSALREHFPVYLCGTELGVSSKTSGNPFL